VSVALPGSIVANAKSHDQKTFLAGQIARALAVFCVDEVVIFDDDDDDGQHVSRRPVGDHEYTAFSQPGHFLAHLLSYLETPPHLRKVLFPMHPNLRTAGTLPSLDMPHHFRLYEWGKYRDGVTVGPAPRGRGGTLVDVGQAERQEIPDDVPPGTRVTLRFTDDKTAEAVSPDTPREEGGYYWGYGVRRCGGLSSVFTESPFDGGYDVSIGTSERGQPLTSALAGPPFSSKSPQFQHVLFVFGGVAGLEKAARNDPELQKMGISDRNVDELFDHWVNLLPAQGSRTIRTEEAVWLGLMGFGGFLERLGKKG
jgi:predicted SPOUT superfamily RNA methylase MTH1